MKIKFNTEAIITLENRREASIMYDAMVEAEFVFQENAKRSACVIKDYSHHAPLISSIKEQLRKALH